MKSRRNSITFTVTAALLTYPAEEFETELKEAGLLCQAIPNKKVRLSLLGTIDWLAGLGKNNAQRIYVETFDFSKKRSLYLTYFTHGDTRERGSALASLSALYKETGLDLAEDELPDFLPALLEFASISKKGESVLNGFRPALEILSSELIKISSPYAKVASAITHQLGPIPKHDRINIAKIQIKGPPTELVGLQPYTVSGLDPERAGTR